MRRLEFAQAELISLAVFCSHQAVIRWRDCIDASAIILGGECFILD